MPTPKPLKNQDKGYSKYYQIKHFLGFVTNTDGRPWMVLETADLKVWLFCQGYKEGEIGNHNCFCATGIQNPVEKNRVVDVVRQALQGGMNIDMRGSQPLIYAEKFILSHQKVEKCQKVKEVPVSMPPHIPLTSQRPTPQRMK